MRPQLLQRIYPRSAVDGIHPRAPRLHHNSLLARRFTGSAVVRYLQCRTAGHGFGPEAAAAAAQVMAEREEQAGVMVIAL